MGVVVQGWAGAAGVHGGRYLSLLSSTAARNGPTQRFDGKLPRLLLGFCPPALDLVLAFACLGR